MMMNKGSKQVGYVRVSSIDQNTDRQLDGVQLDKVFTDHASGKDTNRPALVSCMDYLREGDTLLVHSMDRLARNLEHLRAIVRQLTAKGIQVKFMKESLTFTGENDSPMNTLLLSMLGAVAEFERNMIKERQREGIAIAKNKGVYRGRKAKLDATQAQELKEKVLAGVNKAQLAKEMGISRQTLYSYLSQAD